MKTISLLYIPCQDQKEATKIAEHLLEFHLVACVNIIPIESMYWWNKELSREGEIVIIAKTSETKVENIIEEVERIHSYETPCIIKIKAEVNDEYYKWLEGELN